MQAPLLKAAVDLQAKQVLTVAQPLHVEEQPVIGTQIPVVESKVNPAGHEQTPLTRMNVDLQAKHEVGVAHPSHIEEQPVMGIQVPAL